VLSVAVYNHLQSALAGGRWQWRECDQHRHPAAQIQHLAESAPTGCGQDPAGPRPWPNCFDVPFFGGGCHTAQPKAGIQSGERRGETILLRLLQKAEIMDVDPRPQRGIIYIDEIEQRFCPQE